MSRLFLLPSAHRRDSRVEEWFAARDTAHEWFSRHVNLGFHQGALLPDPAGLLLGTGHYMRHVKLRPGTNAPAPELTNLVSVAYVDIRRRLGR